MIEFIDAIKGINWPEALVLFGLIAGHVLGFTGCLDLILTENKAKCTQKNQE